MRIFWVVLWVLNPMTSVFKRGCRDQGKGWLPQGHRIRDWCDTATSQRPTAANGIGRDRTSHSLQVDSGAAGCWIPGPERNFCRLRQPRLWSLSEQPQDTPPCPFLSLQRPVFIKFAFQGPLRLFKRHWWLSLQQ